MTPNTLCAIGVLVLILGAIICVHGAFPRIHRLVLLTLCLANYPAIPDSCHAGLPECYRATCRISTGHSYGTGCVFLKDDQNYYVLTNAHVAGHEPGGEMLCIFNPDGFERGVNGKTVWASFSEGTSRDQAIIAIPVASFTEFQPTVIPLAPADYAIESNATVVSVGCPKGGWACAWQGHVLNASDSTLSFQPTPAPGRSGSAIFDAAGEKIIGLIAWSAQDFGIAQTIGEVHRGLSGITPVSMPGDLQAAIQVDDQGWRPADPVQQFRPFRPQGNCPTCPQQGGMGGGVAGGNCPNGNCPQQPSRGGGSTPPFAPGGTPTAPPATRPPSQPADSGCKCPDTSGLTEAINKLTGTLASIESRTAKLEAEIEAIKKLPVTSDVPGPAGPPGPQGPAGKDAEIDYDKMAAAIIAKLPPITIQTVDDSGVVRDSDTVSLGGVLKLRLHPIK